MTADAHFFRGSDAALLAALRSGDEATFAALVDRWSGTLLRLARSVLQEPASAEEIVQDAWVAFLDGLDRFEGRSSLRTWLCQIVLNKARTRAARDARNRPHDDDAAPELFDHEGQWLEPVAAWQPGPDSQLERAQLGQRLEAELGRLPELQRLVVVLRDVEGLEAAEVCHTLGLSETNQRQLLHRGRACLRAALAEEYAR